MDDIVLVEDAFEDGPAEEIKCIKCGARIVLWYNGGELDWKDCCGVRYRGESKGYQIIAEEAPSHG
jgi:hypothetical protein